jgi:hypothetical protein
VELLNRSYLTTALSFTAATAIAVTPLVIAPTTTPLSQPAASVSGIALAVAPADIELFIADLEAELDYGTAAVAAAAGVAGRALIGVVENIVTAIDVTFTGLIDATGDQTAAASLTILKTLSHDAFAKLAENLGRINSVITTTTTQVGALVTSAVTGSLQNVLVALVNLANDPLSAEKYLGLLTAGVASVQLLVGNGLEVTRGLAEAAFDVVEIAVDEVTFQIDNAVSGLSALVAQLGSASAAPPQQSLVADPGSAAPDPGAATGAPVPSDPRPAEDSSAPADAPAPVGEGPGAGEPDAEESMAQEDPVGEGAASEQPVQGDPVQSDEPADEPAEDVDAGGDSHTNDTDLQEPDAQDPDTQDPDTQDPDTQDPDPQDPDPQDPDAGEDGPAGGTASTPPDRHSLPSDSVPNVE